MPAVVCDAGPLIHLSQISQLKLLHEIFGEVLVTQKVKFEACDQGLRLHYTDAQLIEQGLQDGWLRVTDLPKRSIVSTGKLAAGENISKADAECLLLAVDKKADLLVDDKVLSSLAKMFGVTVWSTWTLLLEALSRNLISLENVTVAVQELGKRKFKLNSVQAQEILAAANFISKRNKYS